MKERSQTAIWVLAPLLLATCLLVGSAGLGLPDLSSDIGRSVLKLRAYRVVAGFVVGAGLACAGAVLQALLRNPLAEPYVLGVSGGAGLGAAVAIILGLVNISSFFLPGMAFLFGLVSLVLVFTLAKAGGRISIYSLILSGVIVSSVCSSLLMFLVSIAPAEGLRTVMWWMLGDLDVTDAGLFHMSAALIVLAAVVSILLGRDLNAMALGTEMAHNVGVRTGFITCVGLLAATVATSAAVGTAGLIGFVGLIVPHVVRGITGPDHRKLLPAVILFGGTFLAVCDAAAHIVLLPFGPYKLPVGVVTALLGGPFFILVLYRRRRRGWVE